MSLVHACATGAVLESVRRAPTLLNGLARIETLVEAARTDGPEAIGVLQDAVDDQSDQLASIGAVHAAAAGGVETATAVVAPLLQSSSPFLREHAAWALATSPPIPAALSALEALVAQGGFTGMLAETTLEAWTTTPALEPVSLPPASAGNLPSAGAGNLPSAGPAMACAGMRPAAGEG